MFGAGRRGFDWKEIAEVLQMSRTVAWVTFWREIKRSRSKKIEAQSRVIVIQEEHGPETQKSVSPEHLVKP